MPARQHTTSPPRRKYEPSAEPEGIATVYAHFPSAFSTTCHVLPFVPHVSPCAMPHVPLLHSRPNAIISVLTAVALYTPPILFVSARYWTNAVQRVL